MGVLHWQQISYYHLLCLLETPDYPIYFCVAVIAHIQSKILAAARDHILIGILNDPTPSFNMLEHVEFMNQLKEKYSGLVQKDLEKLLSESSCS